MTEDTPKRPLSDDTAFITSIAQAIRAHASAVAVNNYGRGVYADAQKTLSKSAMRLTAHSCRHNPIP